MQDVFTPETLAEIRNREYLQNQIDLDANIARTREMELHLEYQRGIVEGMRRAMEIVNRALEVQP